MKLNFRRTFLTGLFIALPVLITFWVVFFVVRQVDGAISPIMVQFIRLLGLGQWIEQAWVDYVAPVFSVGMALVLIYGLGLVGGNVLGRQMLQGVERLLMQVPVVRSIYSATRQFLDTFSNSNSRAFRRVVLVEYPRNGVWTIAFVTSDTGGEVQHLTSRTVLSVFIPTTPNPTSGWLLFVPEDEVIPLTMTVDDAFKLVISGGVLTPPFPVVAAAAVAATTAGAHADADPGTATADGTATGTTAGTGTGTGTGTPTDSGTKTTAGASTTSDAETSFVARSGALR